MKNILLAGLIYDANLGDQAIYYSTKNMVENCVGSGHEIRAIDLYGRKCQPKVHNKYVAKVLNKLFPNKRTVADICEELNKQLDSICDETEAIVFVGGGLIKYKHQVMAEPMITVLNYAEKHNIPVMLSAVGVEGYDENNELCQSLKKAINGETVKRITTRDDLDLLKTSYVERNIPLAQVADPACSLSKIYKIENNHDKKIIGLGIGRKGLFTDYENAISDEYVCEFWYQLYSLIVKSGNECRFFTNGLGADYDFAKMIIKKYNLPKNILIKRPDSLKELIEQINTFSGMVVTRLHSSIIAYSYNIPCISLVWNRKQVMFGQAIGKPKNFVEKTFIAESVFQKLETDMLNRDNVSDREDYINSTQHEIKCFLEECGICTGE